MRDSEIFLNGPGPNLQKQLIKNSWMTDNYVSEWWEDFHYLNSRAALMFGTSIYISDNINAPKTSQATRAANLIYLMIKYREEMDTFEPLRLRNTVPICAWQYERLFNATRIPGVETDKMHFVKRTEHVIIIHKGNFYKMKIMLDGEILRAADILKQVENILELGEEFVGNLFQIKNNFLPIKVTTPNLCLVRNTLQL